MPDLMKCTACGYYNSTGPSSCKKCGASLRASGVRAYFRGDELNWDTMQPLAANAPAAGPIPALPIPDILPGQMKKCPFCAEEIQHEAIVCKHCRRDLGGAVASPTAGKGAAPGSRRARKWPWILVAAIVFFGFYIWANSPGSVNLDAATKAIAGLEHDRVMANRDCTRTPPRASFDRGSWRQLTDSERDHVMLALVRVCIDETKHFGLSEADLIDVQTNIPIAHFDGDHARSR